MAALAQIHLIETRQAAAAVLHPIRGRILEELGEPDSAAGVARRLEIPRQKVNYHLRQLENEKLVELVEERRKGNCTERVVRASARSYLISPTALGSLAADPEKVRDRFSASYLMALAARTLRDLAKLRRRAGKAGKRLPTFSLQTEIRFAGADQQNAFAEELATRVAELSAKYHDETAGDGRTFRLLVGSYPKPKADDKASPAREET